MCVCVCVRACVRDIDLCCNKPDYPSNLSTSLSHHYLCNQIIKYIFSIQ